MQITVPPKRLSESISSTDSSFKLNNIQGWDDNDLTSGDMPTPCFCVFQDSSGKEIELMQIDPTTIASASITIIKRGLNPSEDGTFTEVSANKKAWVQSTTIVNLGTNPPQMYADFLQRTSSNPQTITSDIKYQGAITHDEHISTKKYADDLAIAGSPDATTTVKGIVEIATPAEVEAGTGTGGTGAKLVVPADSTHLPNDDEMAALAGTGTPNATNKYVTNDDVSNAAVSGKVVRAIGTALPALSAINLTNIAHKTVNNNMTETDYFTTVIPAPYEDSVGEYVLWTKAATATINNGFYSRIGGANQGWYVDAPLAITNTGDEFFWSGSKIKLFKLNWRAYETASTIDYGFGLCTNASIIDLKDESSVTRQIKFTIDGSDSSKLFAITADGTTRTKTEITGITIADYNVYGIEWNPGTNAKFYINGVLKATITTNLPSSNNPIYFGLAGGDTGAVARDMDVSPITMSVEM